MTKIYKSALAIALVLALGCDSKGLAGPNATGDLFWLRDSPNSVLHGVIEELILSQTCDLWVDDRGFEGLDLYVNALTGGPTFENEIHDCQRLVTEAGNFGPMVGVMPLDSAMGSSAEATLAQRPAAIATVFNWSYREEPATNSYDTLGIGSADPWSCLWIDIRSHKAAVVKLEDESVGCSFDDAGAPDAREMNLFLERHSENVTPPRTSRWRWDEDTGLHYLGIRCGDQWCSVTADSTITPQASETMPGPGGTEFPAGRVDVQHLAVAKNGVLEPGPLGRIFPGEAARLGVGNTTRVAQIVVDTANGGSVYVDKFGSPTLQGSTYVWEVNIALTETADLYDYNGGAPQGLRRLMNEKHAASNSVRWRWRLDDEEWWIPCIEGCCTPEN